MSCTVGFVGAGNMGGAIISGLVGKGGFDASSVYVCDHIVSDKVKNLNINVTNLSDLVCKSDYIILCVKPNVIVSVLNDIKNIDGYKNKVYVSIAAGIKISAIKAVLGDVKTVRTMPNLPLVAGEGMTVICRDDKISDEEFEFAAEIFSRSGKVQETEEKLIDSCTAINGSGPAYVFMFIEALADAAVKNGIKRSDAYELSAQMIIGSAKMFAESGKHPGELKDMVCSPGGTTIAAVAALEEKGFRSAVISAVDECTKKAVEMGK